MDVCTVPSSPPLFFEAVSGCRPSANNNSTPLSSRQSRSRLTISPIRLQLTSPRLSNLLTSPTKSSPRTVSTPAPHAERSSLFRSLPAPAPMGYNTPMHDPDARNLFPSTPQPVRSHSMATNMKSKIPILQVSDASASKPVTERKGIQRPTLNRNSSSMNDVKESFSIHSAKTEQATRVRRKSSVGRRPASTLLAPGGGRHSSHGHVQRRDDSHPSRPRSVGNIFNITVPPDPSPSFSTDESPFLDRDRSPFGRQEDDVEDEDDTQMPPSPTTSAVPESFSNSSLLSLSASTSSLPPPTPDDLEPPMPHEHEKQLDSSSSYFNNVLPLQTVFQPTTIAKKYKGPGRGSDAHLQVPPQLDTRFPPKDSLMASSSSEDALITPGITPHPSWPASTLAQALHLPAPPVPPTPAHPIMPPTPTKKPNVHFPSSLNPTLSSAFLVRLKDVIAKEAPPSAPQHPRARSNTHKIPRPSLPCNLPSYGAYNVGSLDSPETSPSVRTAQRHARAQTHREPVGHWARKSVAFERPSPDAPLSHPRRDVLRRTSSSASAWSDTSSPGDAPGSDDSQDVDMVTPTRGPGGRISWGSGLTRTPAVDFALGLQRTASDEYPSPPETSPLIERAARHSAAHAQHIQPGFNGRASLNPAILRTPASPETSLAVPQHSVKGRHSFPFVKSDGGALGRFERDFISDGQLGRGGFGFTFKVSARYPAPGEEGKVWCVKRRKNPYEGAKDRQRQLEEADILQYLASPAVGGPHPHIVQMIDYWEEQNTLYIRTELCGLGDLSILLQEFGRISEEGLGEARVWKILNEITKGLAHIHQAGILHLDLKPANIFITDDGVLKIGDFGLATRWPRPNAQLERGFEREGDREYMAPEILRGVYGKAADIFSLGVLTLECMCNIVVPDMGEPWHKLRTDDFSDTELSQIASYEMASLIIGMMHSDSTLRPSIQQIRSNPAFQRLEMMMEAGVVGSAIEPEEPTFLTSILGHTDADDGSSPTEADDSMDVDM